MSTPDPAEVAALAAAMHAQVAGAEGEPPENYRLCARAALKWMQGKRGDVAEDIAKAIEKSVCAPGEQCDLRFCPDCTRYAQCQADAATARRIGGAPCT